MQHNDSKYDKIKLLSEYVWEHKIQMSHIENWVSGFNKMRKLTSDEEDNLLYALENFLYFGSRLIRELLKAIYRDIYKYNIIEFIRRNNFDTLNSDFIQNEFNKELILTRFLGVGNPSESGVHLLYYFRQENNLSKDNFINQIEVIEREHDNFKLKDSNIKHYVFIDDFCGTGTQAVSYLKEIVSFIKSCKQNTVISYISLFSTSHGLQHIRENLTIDHIKSAYELDNSFMVFSEESRFFGNSSCPINANKELLKEICKEFASRLGMHPKHLLGYNESQLMIAFHHNTPDNTLPIFWHPGTNGNWNPIFKRYHKF